MWRQWRVLHVLFVPIWVQRILTLQVSNGFSVPIPVISDSFSKDKSFMYGRSVSSQGIEAWWSQLRRRSLKCSIHQFAQLREGGLYCDSNPVHVHCLRFCYMDLIRDELHRFARLWNNHRIRPSINWESPSSRPDLLYYLPEVSATQDSLVPIDNDYAILCEQQLCGMNSTSLNCSEEFSQLANIIMNEENLMLPKGPMEARIFICHWSTTWTICKGF